MINKYAEIRNRIILYNACKGILRVKQAGGLGAALKWAPKLFNAAGKAGDFVGKYGSKAVDAAKAVNTWAHGPGKQLAETVGTIASIGHNGMSILNTGIQGMGTINQQLNEARQQELEDERYELEKAKLEAERAKLYGNQNGQTSTAQANPYQQQQMSQQADRQ